MQTLTCNQLSDFHVICFSQKSDQSRDSITVLYSHLVFIILPIGDVSESPAGLTMDLWLRMVEQAHQDGYPFKVPHVLFDFVILIAQVLQVGRGVRLDWINRVAEHGDDFGEVGVPPPGVFANAVDRGGALPQAVNAGHASSLRLCQWCCVATMKVRDPFFNHLCLDGVIVAPVKSNGPKRKKEGGEKTHLNILCPCVSMEISAVIKSFNITNIIWNNLFTLSNNLFVVT